MGTTNQNLKEIHKEQRKEHKHIRVLTNITKEYQQPTKEEMKNYKNIRKTATIKTHRVADWIKKTQLYAT